MLSGMTDFLGNSIYVGDYVVWTARQGSTQYLTKGIVQDFGTTQDGDSYILVEPQHKSWGWSVGRPVRLTHPAYIVRL